MVCIANNIWSITWASLSPSLARAARCIVRGRDGEDRCIVSTVATARTTSEIVDQHPTERPNNGQPTPFARSLVRSFEGKNIHGIDTAAANENGVACRRPCLSLRMIPRAAPALRR